MKMELWTDFDVIVGLAICIAIVSSPCCAQSNVKIPLSPGSFRNILRAFEPVPTGRMLSSRDVRILYYGKDSHKTSMYRIGDIKNLLKNPEFDIDKPTVMYIHGYVEKTNDDSVLTVVNAYQNHGGYNLLTLDWSNLAFGSYVNVILGLQKVGEETGVALLKLLKSGLPIDKLHLIGHSLGAHLAGTSSRFLQSSGFKVPRVTGLDPAYPGFYPAFFSKPLGRGDAKFVDVIHTDGGGFGEPLAVGHADFWPNHGTAKQPGCPPVTVVLTIEDFCSHWRSWKFWAESIEGGYFLARRCEGYDSFLRGRCREAPTVLMGLNATSDLRGNFYLRTAASSPFALGKRGAD